MTRPRARFVQLLLGLTAILMLACRSTSTLGHPVEVLNDEVLSISYQLLFSESDEYALIGFHNHSSVPVLLPLYFTVRRSGRDIVINAGSRCDPAQPYFKESIAKLGMRIMPERWIIVKPGRSVMRYEWIANDDDSLVVSAWMRKARRHSTARNLDDAVEVKRLEDSLVKALHVSCVLYLAFNEEVREDGRMQTFKAYDNVKADSVLEQLRSSELIDGRVIYRQDDIVPYMNIPDSVYSRYVKYERILRKTP